MKPTYTYVLITLLAANGLQVGSKGFYRGGEDWFPNALCREHDECLFTLDLNYVSIFLEVPEATIRSTPDSELWKLVGFLAPPDGTYTEVILVPLKKSYLEYVAGGNS
jgi:hypothetical protein